MKLHRMTYVVFLFFLGVYVLGNHLLLVSDPVESNYALTAKEMVLSGDWLSPQIYGHYWFDKPIMIYWLLSLSYSVFGITDFAARFPSAFFGALSVALLYQGGRTLTGHRRGTLLSAFILGTSLIVWIIAHGIITDMVLLFATVGTFYYAYRGLLVKNSWYIAVAYGFAGIAVLTKGPVGLVLPGLLFLVYAGVKRSLPLVKALFPWQGILVFLAIVLPWYGYMYHTHGMEFINGFLGLHNVTRATQSEHPEVNHWWYYLPIFLGGSLPWTGAILYGMYRGWKTRTDAYLYTMIMGWGTILFYTMMATKYPTYTFISVIPFSLLGAYGIISLKDASYRAWWWVLGPTLVLWWALGVGTFFAPWGFWWILRAFVVGLTIFLGGCYWYGKRLMMPFTVGMGTLVILGIVLIEGLVPFLALRSSVTYHEQICNFHGPVYYYGEYAASVPYYLDITPVRVEPSPERLAKYNVQRSAKWNDKHVMPQIEEQELFKRLQSGERMLIITNKNYGKELEESLVGPYLERDESSSKVVLLHSR